MKDSQFDNCTALYLGIKECQARGSSCLLHDVGAERAERHPLEKEAFKAIWRNGIKETDRLSFKETLGCR